jgi:biopolymer transport protein ExbD
MTMTARSLRLDARAVQAEINVTPLIDVLLALVMILMVIAPLALHRITLPLGGDGGLPPPHTLSLSVKSTGELYLDGAAVSRGQLATALGLAANAPAPTMLDIHAEATASYDDVAHVLALAKSSGMDSIRVEGIRAD